MEKITPEIQNKIIEEWKEIAIKHIEYSESSKLAWVEFSGKIEKEYGLTAWQVWELVRRKKTNNKETTKWYKKSFYFVTERNFLSVLLFIMSIAFYAIEKMSDNKTARLISIYSFFLGIGENIGDRIGEKYSRKDIGRLLLLFIAIGCIILLIVDYIFKGVEIIEAVLIGVGVGGLIGFEIKQLRKKNLMD